MTRYARSITGILTGGLLVLAVGVAAASPQDPSSGGQSSRPAPAQQGPLVLKPISSGFVFTPEVRYTQVNRSWGTMIGGSGGWLYDESLFVGGAFYGLVGGADNAQLWYGGLVTGWSAPVSHSVRLGVRGLFGWGHSETFGSWTSSSWSGHHSGSSTPVTQTAWVFQDFLVFEPQAAATFRLGQKLALDVSGGYRLTGNNFSRWSTHVNGAFAGVGLRLGVF